MIKAIVNAIVMVKIKLLQSKNGNRKENCFENYSSVSTHLSSYRNPFR